ncbi:hypothetical protein AYO44_02140 [Planctomycetaceae bacterium SCGC AG-212-F19]|nr:hypothetical protein AYO44_02140 [Planctomycetaceae bacterium SCGC AG-212-F19]
MRHCLAGIVMLLGLGMGLHGADPKPTVPEKVLFDFEDAAELKAWSNLELPDPKQKEPAARIELATEHATSGKHSLKITFAGGTWPAITTTQIPEDWTPYQTFKADVTVSRPCLIGFLALQEKSKRDQGWDGGISRWARTFFLKPGKNEIVTSVPEPSGNPYAIHAKYGKVVRFEIFMYSPHEGESIYVDNIRLSAEKQPKAPPAKTDFRVLGTDMVVTGVIDLGKKLKDRWTKPEPKTVAQIEAEFQAKYAELKKMHPKAVLAILRDGEKGYDPANADKVYAGWKDAYWSSHGPDGITLDRARNEGKNATQEIFMRHRSPLMRVDVGSIPKGADILAAQLVIVPARDSLKGHEADMKPTMWVAEPCNRPWEEYEVNTYWYAKDKYWKATGGMNWGEDPDFLPVYLAHGPGGAKVNAWDFTEAVKFWTDGKHPNHGFMLHGDSHGYITGWTREAPEVKNRPAVLVIYEPK